MFGIKSSNRRTLLAALGIFFALAFATVLPQSDASAAGPYKVFLPLTLRNYVPGAATPTPTGYGTITGTVVSAVPLSVYDDPPPVGGATVCILDSAVCKTTDTLGNFSFTNTAAGRRTLSVTYEGYYPLTQAIDIVNGQSTTTYFALSPRLAGNEKMRFVLTWVRTNPTLDIHLWLPVASQLHLYWNNPSDCAIAPYACLQREETAGRGPETITLGSLPDGNYVIAAQVCVDTILPPDEYGGCPTPADIAGSGARMQVYSAQAGGMVAQYELTKVDTGNWWHILDISVTGGVPVVQSVNTIAATSAAVAPYLDPASIMRRPKQAVIPANP